jgi:hypothetical protein
MEMRHFTLIISLVALVALGGCTSIKKMTGQTNDTVLPGEREDVLASDQQTARDPIVTGQEETTPCDPNVTDCPADVPQ